MQRIAESIAASAGAEVEVTIDPDIVSAKEWAERQLAFTRAERELAETQERVDLTRNRGSA